MSTRPLIAITMGDPAGIGPEIIIKAHERPELFAQCTPVVIGCAGVMAKALAGMRLAGTVRNITSPAECAAAPGRIDLIDLGNADLAKHQWGRPNASSGKAAVEYVKTAADLALAREVEAIVTAPLNKELMNAAGYDYAGHTELLAHLTGATDYGMLFSGGGLKIMLATIHHPLKDVPGLITKDRVLRIIRLAHRAMRSFGIDRPRIGVAALNPHASEGGLFGNEEWNELLPAVLEARGEGIHASDPIPADTLFYKARTGHYDIVVAMYHDQGLAPLKMLAFGNAVNITVGLPIIRTSVDHGTAYDIAGTGCADPASLLEAVRAAAELAAYRRRDGDAA